MTNFSKSAFLIIGLTLSACGSANLPSLPNDTAQSSSSSSNCSPATGSDASSTTPTDQNPNTGLPQNGNTNSPGAPLPLVDDPVQPTGGVGVWQEPNNIELYAASGSNPNDVVQGITPDCSLEAPLTSIVYEDPSSITKMIKPVGQTSKGYTVYSITFYNPKGRTYSTLVDDELLYQGNDNPYDPPVIDAVNGKRIIWASLVRKANAIRMGGYDQTSAPPANAFSALTGYIIQSYGQQETPPLYSIIPQDLAVKRPTTAGTITVMAAATAKNPAIFQFNSYVCIPYGGTTYCAPLAHEVAVYDVTPTNVIVRNQWGPYASYSAGQSGNGIVNYPYYVFLQLFQATYTLSPDPIYHPPGTT